MIIIERRAHSKRWRWPVGPRRRESRGRRGKLRVRRACFELGTQSIKVDSSSGSENFHQMESNQLQFVNAYPLENDGNKRPGSSQLLDHLKARQKQKRKQETKNPLNSIYGRWTKKMKRSIASGFISPSQFIQPEGLGLGATVYP